MSTIVQPATKEQSPPPRASRSALSLFAAGVVFLLLVASFIITLIMLLPLTKPTAYFEQLTQMVSQNLNEKKTIDQQSVDLAVMLEYASASLRVTGVQIAFSLFAGFVFLVTGILLLAAEFSETLSLEYATPGNNLNLKNATPGFTCLIFAAIIIFYGISRQVSTPFKEMEVNRPVMSGVKKTMLVTPAIQLEQPDAKITAAEKSAISNAPMSLVSPP